MQNVHKESHDSSKVTLFKKIKNRSIINLKLKLNPKLSKNISLISQIFQ